jgi:hypothetical protein
MESASKKTILRIELWHGLILLTLLAVLAPRNWIEPQALLIGGVFMGVNFLLLGLGVAWVLTPLASRKRVKIGVGLLVLKTVIFLGLLLSLFFKFSIDAISFSVGFSSLLLAIVLETLRINFNLGTD